MVKRCSKCKEVITPVTATICPNCEGTSFDYSYDDQGLEPQTDQSSPEIQQMQAISEENIRLKAYIEILKWVVPLVSVFLIILTLVLNGRESNGPSGIENEPSGSKTFGACVMEYQNARNQGLVTFSDDEIVRICLGITGSGL